MQSVSYYIKEPRGIGKSLLYRFGGILSDSLYLRLMYYFQTGKLLHLKHPKTYNEKLQWLKLYDRRPEYTTMVDKYAAKGYVADIIGQEYIIPTLGVWDSPEKIAWDELPAQFVLKTTQGGGSKGVVICRDKSLLNREETIKRLRSAMKQDMYKNWREWAYKGVKPRVIAEEFLSDGDENNSIKDYKFYCFNGKPLYCGVYSDRWGNKGADYFDMEWSHLPFTRRDVPFAKHTPARPQHFETMCQLSTLLSASHPHIRVDFYEVNDKVFFGELTFYTASGYGQFFPAQWDEVWGSMLDLTTR